MLLRLLYPVTRNSAIADKPHDAFVQYAMAWLTPPPPLLNTSLLICVTTLNLVILRQGVRITKATQKWGAMGPRVLGRGVPGLLQTRPSSARVTNPNLIIVGQTARAYTWNDQIPPEKMGPRVPVFKITQGHRK